jgi:hypothetical protein
MKRFLSAIGICLCALVYADSTVTIPMTYKNVESLTESADDPGSSTVDPVDPNQAKAELTNNTLKVYEGLEGKVQIEVKNTTYRQVILQTYFDESITITLTDTAQYTIHLSHPKIGDAYGLFRYPIDDARKIMQNGNIYILHDNHSYCPNGMKIE